MAALYLFCIMNEYNVQINFSYIGMENFVLKLAYPIKITEYSWLQ